MVPVEEGSRLTTVHRIIGRVEVEHQLPGRTRERIFVSQRDRVDPLAHHRHHLVANLPALAWFTEPTCDPLGQPEPVAHLAQQQRPP